MAATHHSGKPHVHIDRLGRYLVQFCLFGVKYELTSDEISWRIRAENLPWVFVRNWEGGFLDPSKKSLPVTLNWVRFNLIRLRYSIQPSIFYESHSPYFAAVKCLARESTPPSPGLRPDPVLAPSAPGAASS